MATPTVNRTQALMQRIARLDADPAREAVALGLVDAMLGHDGETLAAALRALRDARARADGDRELAGWLDATIAFAHWGLERLPSPAGVTQGTQAHDFLRALDGAPQLGSAELRHRLEVDETQVSRTGRRLLETGLVSRRKVGRQVFWKLTPRGHRALEEADPTRERIIASTLQLHVRQGIQATTWADIAGETGVPVETIRALFPTQDDLVRSCGEHFVESLHLPPPDQVRDVFAGTAAEHDRIHRLVETLFGVYERGGRGIAVARREREDLPALDESLQTLDDTFDALVVESLRPRRPDIASMRALTDLEVWRTLRDRGATPDAAVEQASAAVEQWLEAQPPR